MVDENKFRFNHSDLNRMTFEKELNTKKIFFRTQETLDHMAWSTNAQVVYSVSDEDYSTASEIFNQIPKESRYANVENTSLVKANQIVLSVVVLAVLFFTIYAVNIGV